VTDTDNTTKPRPAIRGPFKVLGIIILACFALAVGAAIFAPADKPQAAAPAKPEVDRLHFKLLKPSIGCTDESHAVQLARIIGEGDMGAFAQAADGYEDCQRVEAGTPMNWEDGKVLDGVDLIRPQGSPTSLWFPRDTVHRDNQPST
jgi:hypothetical protein